mmetsp:Transcript_53677/g.165116  ORF Transcript_53677/g.165116 Transcript_53677/m.165116 type:complete len:645 (-) Transcript_53677:14-1948(-)
MAASDSTATQIQANVVVRPFTASEQASPFESQPVCRPVLDAAPGNGATTVKVLDPSLKYKIKREFPLRGRVHWFPADGDREASPLPAASVESAVASTSAEMAKNVFEGFNATAVVMGHGKSGKSSILMGDIGSAAKDEALPEGPVPLEANAGLLPRFCNDLFTSLSSKPSNCKMAITVECVGFDDTHTITDMVSAKRAASSGTKHVDPEPLKVREEANGPAVAGTHKLPVSSAASMLDAVQHGYSRYRKFKARASTHLVFIIRCEETLTFADPSSPNEAITKKGYATAMFALVVGRPTAFFRCVDSAYQRDSGDNDKAKVPFREASLTRLLQDFFGGNTFPYSFACVGPHHVTAKDAVVVLEMAAKIEVIRTRPRISYDETTTEFRRLDDEVNTLSTELSAAKEAHEVIQEELSARQSKLDESRRIFQEQEGALTDLRDAKASEELLAAVRKARLARQHALQQQLEEDMREEIHTAEQRKDSLDQEIVELKSRLSASEAALAAAVAEAQGLKGREDNASDEVKRQERRHAEVAASKRGLGAVKEQVEHDFAARVGCKESEAADKRAEHQALRQRREEMSKPIRIAQMASDSLAALRKRVDDAKARKKALQDEAAKLPQEIADLEKEVEQMEKDAAPDPACCVAM